MRTLDMAAIHHRTIPGESGDLLLTLNRSVGRKLGWIGQPAKDYAPSKGKSQCGWDTEGSAPLKSLSTL